MGARGGRGGGGGYMPLENFTWGIIRGVGLFEGGA